MIDRFAVFTDETENFVNPYAPKTGDTVNFKIRTHKRDFEKVSIVIDNMTYPMQSEKPKAKDKFEYFSCDVPITRNSNYYYELETKSGQKYFYNRFGFVDNLNPDFNFRILVDFEVPLWARGAVMYQIFVDRFCNGDVTNDVVSNEYMYRGKTWVNGKEEDVKEYVVHVDDWYDHPAMKDNTRFYGGDLQGVLNKMDYLQDLGVDVIYFNPLFVSPSNHKYDTQDYDYIDPHYGVIKVDADKVLDENSTSNRESEKYITRISNFENLEASNDLLRIVIEEAHRRGMKVILDGVFNHCGSFNKWLDREKIYQGQEGYPDGAFVSKDSPYHDYFKFYEDNWPDNTSYDGWWSFEELPKLNYETSDKLKEYIMSIGRKWVSPPYNADGWRLDVAADLGFSREYNHQFWKDFRKTVKEANPNAIILAEHYEDALEWLMGDEWDTIMNYQAFMEPLTYFLTGMEKHSDSARPELCGDAGTFVNTMKWFQGRMPIQSVEISMNELSNHDHSRFMTRTNRSVGRIQTRGVSSASCGINKGVYKEASVFQMTWPGAPTIYYGDEAGLTGWTDPDCRRPYPWGREDNELITFTKELIKIHKSHEALKTGSIMYLLEEYNILSYARFTKDEIMIILLNNNENSYHMDVQVPVERLGLSDGDKVKMIFRSNISGFSVKEHIREIENGHLRVGVDAYSAVIFTSKI